MLTGLEKIAINHAKHPEEKYINLMHHINKQTITEVHKIQKFNKAEGIDEVDKESYDINLENKIDKLISDMKTFSYRPMAVKRVYIPKVGSDKLRPLGIPTYEDKLVQSVMANILNEIYEPLFYDFSYGFRPKRSCHQAIKELNDTLIYKGKVNFIVDVDIKGFFDNVNHEWLIKFLEHEINDKTFIRYIKRFLKSGIIEYGKYMSSDVGTPQGGNLSPILANIYLHYVLDMWFDKVVTKKSEAYCKMIRYADDFVCLFQYKTDAELFYKELAKRLAKFGLTIEPEKSKIISFGKFTNSKDKFDLLGFTFINGRTRNGAYTVVKRTSKKKLKAKKQVIKQYIKENIDIPITKLIDKLNIRLIGHYRYYGIKGNSHSLHIFHNFVSVALYKRMCRRGHHGFTFKKFITIMKYYPLAMPKLYNQS